MDSIQLRDRALLIISEFRHSSSDAYKMQLVKRLTSLDIERAPLCVEDILHEVAGLDHLNESPEVKKELVTFLRKASHINLGWEVLCSVANWLSGIVAQENPPVVLAIVQSCPSLTRNVFTQALDKGLTSSVSNGWQDAWTKTMTLIRAVIDTALKAPSGPITLYAAKLVEHCILMFTNPSDSANSSVEQHITIPPNHPIFNVSHLHSMSQVLVHKLVAKISSKTVQGGLAQIAILKALGSIARHRAIYAGRIVPALLDLAASGEYLVASMCRSASNADGVGVSVSTALKEALLGALMNRDPTARVWKKRLLKGLECIGAVSAADKVIKQIDKQADKNKRVLKPQEQEQPHSKRLKCPEDHGQTGRTIDSTPQMHPSSADVVRSKHEIPRVFLDKDKDKTHKTAGVVKMDHDVPHVQALLGLLASIGQRKLLHGFVNNLDIRILADVVIANLKDLPEGIQGTHSKVTVENAREAHLSCSSPRSTQGCEEYLMDDMVLDTSVSEASSACVQAPSIDSDEDDDAQGDIFAVGEGGDDSEFLQHSILSASSTYVLEDPHDISDMWQGDEGAGATQMSSERKQKEMKCDPDVNTQNDVDASPIRTSQELQCSKQEPFEAGLQDGVDKSEHTETSQDKSFVQGHKILPRPLTMGQSTSLIEQGILPLIKANALSNKHTKFSQGILSKLAGASRVTGSPAHTVLEHIVQGFPKKTSIDLAVKWLFSIFLYHGSPTSEKLSESAVYALEEADMKTPEFPGMGAYEEALSTLLERLIVKVGDPRDKSLISFLLDIPALPVSPVTKFLQAVSLRGPFFATMALTSANTLMEERPPLRSAMLHLVLMLATSNDKDTREKAVRLVKNKLYNDDEFISEIDAFATRMLNQLRVKCGESSADEFLSETQENSEDLEKFCSLYMALCTRKKSLLRGLMEVYGAANDRGQEAVYANAPKLADAIGYNSPELLELIRETPAGGDQLLLMMLTVMPSRIPSPRVVHACKERFKLKADVRFIVPALPGLPKREALCMVPQLARLSIPDFSAAILALIARTRIDEPIEPSEVLVALNRASLSDQGVKLADVRAALDHCVRGLADIFDREALAGALNKMVQLPTLPLLFMRLVLVSIAREIKLCAFVLGTLFTSNVVIEKILKERSQWRGYLVLMGKSVPLSYKHLLELPTTVLRAVLKDSSREFVKKFHDYVTGSECEFHIPLEAMSILIESVDKSELEPSLLGESEN